MESKRGGVMYGRRNEDTLCTVVTMLMFMYSFILWFNGFHILIKVLKLFITHLVCTISDNIFVFDYNDSRQPEQDNKIFAKIFLHQLHSPSLVIGLDYIIARLVI